MPNYRLLLVREASETLVSMEVWLSDKSVFITILPNGDTDCQKTTKVNSDNKPMLDAT